MSSSLSFDRSNAHRCLMRIVLGVVSLLTLADALHAQNSSLLSDQASEVMPAIVGNRMPQSAVLPATPESGAVIIPAPPTSPQLAAASWTYAPSQASRVLRVHDIISIRVDEVARMLAEGRATQRKNAIYDAVLKDWLELDGFGVRKAPQAAGDPQVNAQLNEQYRATSDLMTRETLAFNIASEIADIRPNGMIVLEAHKSIAINDNRWEISLSGMCQAKDITPDNVILSKDIIDLKIEKRESGQARDGYRRGWFTEWFNRLQPF